MADQKPPESDIADEFRNLSKNLSEALHAAWDRPERRKFQQDLEKGLTELGSTLKREVEHLAEHPASQRIRSEAEEVASRVRSGEVEQKARSELINALRMVNNELQKFINNQPSSQPGPESPVDEEDAARSPQSTANIDNQSPSKEVHPDDVDTSTHPTTSNEV